MFFNNKLQIKTTGYSQNDYGEIEDDQEITTTDFRGSIQPLNQEEKRLMNKNGEGNRPLNYCKLYTYPNIKIRTKSDNDNFTDTVIFEDKEYEVVSRDFFRSGLISHNKYILQEITNNEGDEENASEL